MSSVLNAAEEESENSENMPEVLYTNDVANALKLSEIETLDEIPDPLQEDAADKKADFPWEFKDDIILSQQIKVEDPIGRRTSGRNKRKRMNEKEWKGRNGFIWQTNRTYEHDVKSIVISSLQPRGKGPASSVDSALDAWYLLLDEPILVRIVKFTNKQIRKSRSRISTERQTDLIELRAWIGLNYLCGLFRNGKHCGPLDELWTNELGNSIFRATMQLKRFKFLAECLCFNDSVSESVQPISAIGAARIIWEKFIINCRSYYAPSEYCNIHEHVVCDSNADGKSIFELSLPQSPQTKGLRILCLHDAKTLYMHNAIVTESDIPNECEVFNLVCDIKNTKRNVTLNERYTSMQLANNLLKREISITGVLAANADDMPPELLKDKTQHCLYAGSTTLSVDYNKNEEMQAILSSGLSPNFDAKILYAVTSKSGERFQQLASIYSSSYGTPLIQQRWSLRFFHTILDYAALNAWVLYRLAKRGDASLTQRDFQRQLGLHLTQQQIKRRLKSKLPLLQRIEISEMLGEATDKLLTEATTAATNEVSPGTIPTDNIKVPEDVVIMPKMNDKRKRCRKCKNKTRLRCQQCMTPLCNHHMVSRCLSCCGIKQLPS